MSGIGGTFDTFSVFPFRKPSCSHASVFKLPFQSSFVDIIHLLTATGLTTGGSSTVHICTQTIHILTCR
jgi:hypothetical protein